MGITIFYRGSLDDVSRVEDFEDRVLDLALDLGGTARIWRTAADDTPERVIRGLTVDLFPGQETTSLLIAPEGWLVGLFEVEAAERGELKEAPTCWVKTQFGPVEGHAALIELLAAIKQEFISNLHVHDEADYWERRDLADLMQRFGDSSSAIRGLADALEHSPLSAEAAEDPQILEARIVRIAEQVRRTLSRPAEHAPVQFASDNEWDDDDDEGEGGTEAEWDELYKENLRKQERMQRSIEEQIQQGKSPEEAFEHAMRDPGILNVSPDFDETDEDEEWLEQESDEDWQDAELSDEDDEVNEAWQDDESADDEDESEEDEFGRPRDPLLRRATEFVMRLDELLKDAPDHATSHADVLVRGAMEMAGSRKPRRRIGTRRWGCRSCSSSGPCAGRRSLAGRCIPCARKSCSPTRTSATCRTRSKA